MLRDFCDISIYQSINKYDVSVKLELGSEL